MKYTVNKQKRYNLRCNGSFASYPVLRDGTVIGSIDGYAEEINGILNDINNGINRNAFNNFGEREGRK